ncbi:MAG: hypothetical protein Harvfovirus1_44 [Harvfovirus sp.]|uniref:Potassium channel tetramerisation-type BTB domain-containing protein n=1 Tax=Harvfovirus sp. TaxID=2487768 RepID=A0A3G5A4M3_9VIRU|nr:MAG: hypothetical protein Harvfovirus1_44 [Harvfovirus sp.]
MEVAPTITIHTQWKKFTTLKTTLLRGKYFQDKIDDSVSNIYLDLSAKSFENILDHLRCPHISKIKYQYRSEADFILNNEPLYKINIGGEKFLLSAAILKKMDYFNALLTNWKHSISEEIFVDNNPNIFQILIRHLTDPDYSIPPYLKFSEQFRNDLDYYGLNIIGFGDEISLLQQDKTAFAHDCNYFTGNPQVTYFKNVYRRSTYFDFEYKNYCPVIDYDKLNNGEEIRVSLPSKIFPMIAALYIIIELDPSISISSAVSNDVKWIEHVESFVFENISVKLDAKEIDSFSSEARYIHNMINVYEHHHEHQMFYQKYPEDGPPAVIKDNVAYANRQEIYTPPSLSKIIIPFNEFFWQRVPFPLFTLNDKNLDIDLKMADLKALVCFGENILDDIPITKMSLVVKNIHLSNTEANRFLAIGHEYATNTMQTYSCLLIGQTEFRIPITGEYCLDSIFIYFQKSSSVLPFREKSFHSMSLLMDGKIYCDIDRDLLCKIMEIEKDHSYFLKNIYNYNLGYNRVCETIKGVHINLQQCKLELIIRMKLGFESNRVVVLGKGQYILQLSNNQLKKIDVKTT